MMDDSKYSNIECKDADIDSDESQEKQKSQLIDVLQKDSILEKNVIATSQKLISSHQEPPATVVKFLMGSYCGYPHMCSILLSALDRAHNIDESNATDLPSADVDTKSSYCGNLITQILADILCKKFDKSIADDVLMLFTETPPWLKTLVLDPLYRKALIGLYEKNSSSALLNLCIREISLAGFNSEISQIAMKSDFFEVFNNTFQELLMRVISHCLGAVAELVSFCCRCEYTFLYTMELLRSMDKILSHIQTHNELESVNDAIAAISRVYSSSNRNSSSSSNNMNSWNYRRKRKVTTSTAGREIATSALTLVRFLQQQLEFFSVWSSTSSLSPSCSTALAMAVPAAFTSQRLSGKQFFALRIIGLFTGTHKAANPMADAVVFELLDFISSDTISVSTVSRLFNKLFRIDDAAVKTAPTSSRSFYRWKGDGLSISDVRAQLGHFRVVERCIETLISTIIVSPTSSSSSSWNPAISGGLSITDHIKIAHVMVLSSRLCGESLIYGSLRADEEKQCENYGNDVHGAGFSVSAIPDTKPSESVFAFVDDSYEVDNKLIDKLLQLADICTVISDKMEIKLEDLRKAKYMSGLISQHPLVSITALRWIAKLLFRSQSSISTSPSAAKDDWGSIPMEFFVPTPASSVMSSSVLPAARAHQPLLMGAGAAGGSLIHRGLALLPLLLQFIVTAIKAHPMQRNDAFYLLSRLLAALMDRSEDAGSESVASVPRPHRVIAAQNDVVDSLLYLIGSGFVELPLRFLSREVQRMDKAAQRHLFQAMTLSFQAPFSFMFVTAFVRLFFTNSARSVMNDSTHWSKADMSRLSTMFDSFSGIELDASVEKMLTELKALCCRTAS